MPYRRTDFQERIVIKIIHVANNAAPQFGGAYRSIEQFCSAATTRDHRSHCISFDDDPSGNPHQHNPEWTVVPTCRGILGRQYALISRRKSAELSELVQSADVVCLHLLYRYHAIWAARCARKFQKPLIVVPHGCLDPYVFTYRDARKKAWLRLYHQLLFRQSVVLYATDREREKAAAVVGDVDARSLYWPVDDEIGQVADHVPVTPRRLLYVGRLHPMKRVLETVRSFCRLRPPGWHLVIIGPVTAEIPLQTLRASAGAEWNRSIVYRGALDRQSLYAEYRAASALVLASHRENFGHVVAEAMSFGLPVLISEDVDLCTLVKNTGSGLVVPIHSENDVLECLSLFLSLTRDELESRGQSARTAAAQHFDFRTFANSFNTLLENLAGQAGAGLPEIARRA
jgi:glycosyltransferase involved in cell wall biosynthesis